MLFWMNPTVLRVHKLILLSIFCAGLDIEEGINEEMKRGRKKVWDLSKEEVASRLAQQEANNPKWHLLVQGNLILNQGLIYKRKVT
jgi:hypothetical protein